MVLVFCLLGTGHAAVLIPADLTELSLRPHVEVLEDRHRQWRLEDVESAAFEQRFRSVAGTGDLNFGFTSSAYWMRVQLASAAPSTLATLLEVAHPSLDRVELFSRRDGVPIQLRSGYMTRFAERPFAHRNHVFPLALAPGTTQTVYLRVVSRGSLTVPLNLWSPAALHTVDQQAYSLLAFYFGMIVALSVYNLLLYFSLRDPIYAVYAAFAVCMGLAQAAMQGLGNAFLWGPWPEAGNWILPSCFSLTGLFAAEFVRRFLDTANQLPRINRLILVVQVGFLIAAVGPAFFPNPPFAIATAVLGTLFCGISMLSGLLAIRQGQPSAGLYLAATSALVLGVAAYALRLLGLIPTTFLTSNGMQLGSALEMLMLSLSMANRIHLLRHEKSLAQAEALRSKQAAMDAMQASEKVLEQRIVERTAELAQANAKLQQNEAALKALALQDALTGLANRTQMQLQMEQAVARCNREGTKLAVLMIDLDGFKPINDRYGHAAGDQLLQEIARRLMDKVRATDTVARVGGDEFVVLLEAIHDAAEAAVIRDKLIASICQPIHLAAGDVRVGASVGIAVCPEQTDDIDQLLLLADQDMYRHKASRTAQPDSRIR